MLAIEGVRDMKSCFLQCCFYYYYCYYNYVYYYYYYFVMVAFSPPVSSVGTAFREVAECTDRRCSRDVNRYEMWIKAKWIWKHVCRKPLLLFLPSRPCLDLQECLLKYTCRSHPKCIWLGENRTTDEADGRTRADTFSASLIASGGAFKSAGGGPWRRKLGCKKSLAVRFFPNCHVCSFHSPESKQLMLPLISSCSCKHSSTLSRGDIDVCSSSSSSRR